MLHGFSSKDCLTFRLHLCTLALRPMTGENNISFLDAGFFHFLRIAELIFAHFGAWTSTVNGLERCSSMPTSVRKIA